MVVVELAASLLVGLIIGWRLHRRRRPLRLDITIRKGTDDDHTR